MKALKAAILLLLVSGSLQAQTAHLTGVVKDSTGAVVSGAEIMATQTERNLTLHTLTDEDGRYVLSNLPLGSYLVRGRASGFKVFTQAGVELTVDQKALLNIVLEVGDVN